MGFERLSRLFGMDDDDFNDLSAETPTAQSTQSSAAPKRQAAQRTQTMKQPATQTVRSTGNVVSMDEVKSNQTSKIVLFEPRVYSDSKEVGTHLLNGRAVIVNFTRIDEKQAKRILDFLTGTVFAIKGEVQRVGDCIFLCTPARFEIDGSISDIIRDQKIN